MSDTSPLFVASDIHGHHDALVEALRVRGLVDADAVWTGGDARLWVLGDLFDRGAQGVAVLRLLRRLGDEAAESGGLVDALLGNHEVLVLGSRRFGAERFTDDDGQERQFLHWWVLNGGFEDDLDELTDDEVEWLRTRGAVHLADERSLLLHSDTDCYLDYGRSAAAVNAAVRTVLSSSEPREWWRLFRELTRRHEFLGAEGPARARALLGAFGGEELVHGHSTIPDTTGLAPEEVTEARRYCEGLVLNVDGGVYQGGRCLVVPLRPLSTVRWRGSRQRRSAVGGAARRAERRSTHPRSEAISGRDAMDRPMTLVCLISDTTKRTRARARRGRGFPPFEWDKPVIRQQGGRSASRMAEWCGESVGAARGIHAGAALCDAEKTGRYIESGRERGSEARVRVRRTPLRPLPRTGSPGGDGRDRLVAGVAVAANRIQHFENEVSILLLL